MENKTTSVRKMMRIFFCFLAGLFLLCCNVGKKRSLIAIDISENQVESVLTEAKKYLTGYSFDIHTFSLDEEIILSVWAILPEIDTDSQDTSLIVNSKKAFTWGRDKLITLLMNIPDIFILFDAVNLMIVDKNYNIWYRDIIPLYIFQRLYKTEQEDVSKKYRGEVIYKRITPVQLPSKLGVNLYQWEEVRRKIETIMNPSREINNYTAYPIVFDDYSMIQVYITAVNEKEMEDNVLCEKINSILQIFSQASIVVDIVQIGFLSLNGTLAKSCLIHRSQLEYYNPEDINRIHIISGY